MADSRLPGSRRTPTTLPEVELVDHDGSLWSVADAIGRPVVLILHRHLA